MATIKPLPRAFRPAVPFTSSASGRGGRSRRRQPAAVDEPSRLIEQMLVKGDVAADVLSRVEMVPSRERRYQKIERELRSSEVRPPAHHAGSSHRFGLSSGTAINKSRTGGGGIRSWAPVVVSTDLGFTPLAFHHFLHGLNGRSNDRRRPLIVSGATPVASAVDLDAFEASFSSPSAELQAACKGGMLALSRNRFVAVSAPALPAPLPRFAITAPRSVTGWSACAALRDASVDDAEDALFVAGRPARIRIHQPRAAVHDALRMRRHADMIESHDGDDERIFDAVMREPDRWLADEEDREAIFFAEALLKPGDVFYVPRGIRFDVVPPAHSMLTAAPTSAVLRNPKVKPLDDLTGQDGPAMQVAVTWGGRTASQMLADFDGTGASAATAADFFTRLTLWKWHFSPFPDLTDRRAYPQGYVAANHMTALPAGLYPR